MKEKKSISNYVFHFINFAIFAVIAVVCVFPFYYIFINSFSDNGLVSQGKIMLLPSGIHLSNYVEVFKIDGLFSAALVSLARTVIGTLLSVISAAFVGYAMTKKELWNRKFWYRFIIITMYLNAGVIPTYLNIRNLGLLNSFWVYVLPALTTPFNMILVKTFIESIPDSLEESASLDGAGYLKRFFYIVMPVSKPIIATVAVFSAVGQWNSFMDTVLYMTKNNYHTLQYVLYKYLNEINTIAEMMKKNAGMSSSAAAMEFTPAAVRFTITAVTVLPILLVYPFFQRYIVKGVMIGAVKG